MDKIRICFIGRACSESVSWINNLFSLGCDVTFFNTHPTTNLQDFITGNSSGNIKCHDVAKKHYVRPNIINNAKLLMDHWKIIKASDGFLSSLVRYYASVFSSPNTKYDLLFFYYGSDVFIEMYVILNILGCKIPVLHGINTIPSVPVKLGYSNIEKALYRVFNKTTTSRIYYSDIMKHYFDNNIGKSLGFIAPEPYLSTVYSTGKTKYILKKHDDRPHIIFIGRTDFSWDFRRAKDNVIFTLKILERNMVHVYIQATNKIKESKYIHYYPSFSNNEILDSTFSSYLSQFDASLAIYSKFSAGREKYGMATRFAISLTAGIPIITKSSASFAGTMFRKHKNGFTYDSSGDLIKQLNDKRKMEIYRINAMSNRKIFSFESMSDSFLRFIQDSLNFNE